MMSPEARLVDHVMESVFKQEDADYSSKFPKKFNRMIEKAKIPLQPSERSIDADSRRPKLSQGTHRTSLSMAPTNPIMDS